MVLIQKKLITIQVIYYRLDYQSLLQTFIWQTDDIVPDLPRTHQFLNFWKENIEAKISEVLIAEGTSDYRPAQFYRLMQ